MPKKISADNPASPSVSETATLDAERKPSKAEQHWEDRKSVV